LPRLPRHLFQVKRVQPFQLLIGQLKELKPYDIANRNKAYLSQRQQPSPPTVELEWIVGEAPFQAEKPVEPTSEPQNRAATSCPEDFRDRVLV